ncbi:MAG TPA: VWA domain-containing protein [Edaphobacter sp.]|nr:VWA domain-containing protein [Edaphobacter sp.]
MCAIRQAQILCCVVTLMFLAYPHHIDSQTTANQAATTYGLRVSVDEVLLTFHAADAQGLPVNNLKLDELILSDNGKPPRKILAFESLQNLPLRVGILIDTSDSMSQDLASNETIATRYSQHLLHQTTDQAFVMKFSALSEITQPWTADSNALNSGIRKFAATRANHIRGTGLFNALYQACLNQLGHVDYPGTGNLILLFTDGEENASNASLRNVIDACQHANTAIYAFRPESKSSFSTGPATLTELAMQTGGRVFHSDDSEAAIDTDLRTIEADRRNQYRLIYKPAELIPNGSFHHINLKVPERVTNLDIRSGYYAPHS